MSYVNSSYSLFFLSGFCPHCAVPSPKCVLCTGYKGVYGNDFLIHRFANSKQTNPKNSVNNHVQTVKEKSRKSNQDAVFQKVDHSPVSITVHDDVLSESSPEEEKSFIKNKSYRTSTHFETKASPHLKPKYRVSRALPKDLHSYKLPHEWSLEDSSSDERRPSYSPVLPSRDAMYEYLDNENEIEEYRLASEFPLTYSDNRLGNSRYPFSYSAPTRAARSKLFNRSRHYRSVKAKEKDNFDEESERIQQRIKDLMKKNNSKLVSISLHLRIIWAA